MTVTVENNNYTPYIQLQIAIIKKIIRFLRSTISYIYGIYE